MNGDAVLAARFQVVAIGNQRKLSLTGISAYLFLFVPLGFEAAIVLAVLTSSTVSQARTAGSGTAGLPSSVTFAFCLPCCISSCLAISSPMFAFLNAAGIRLIRSSILVRRLWAWRAY